MPPNPQGCAPAAGQAEGAPRNSSPGEWLTSSAAVSVTRTHPQAAVTRPVHGLKPVDPIRFAARLLQDCLDQSDVSYWLRRADEWHSIDPFVALQCRRHAWILEQTQGGEISPEVKAVMREVFTAVPERQEAGIPGDLHQPAPKTERRTSPAPRRHLRVVA